MLEMESPHYQYNYYSESTNSDVSEAEISYRGEDPRNARLWSAGNKPLNTPRLNGNGKLPTRVPPTLTKFALSARKQRLKRKKYVQDLEKQVERLRRRNKSLEEIVDSNSDEVKSLNKQVKFLKSVLANSSDLIRLMRSIHSGTGMSVTTSLDDTLAFKSNFLSKNYVEQDMTLWNESTLFGEANLSLNNAFTSDGNPFDSDMLLSCDDLAHNPLARDDVGISYVAPNPELTLNEHNYTAKYDDVDIVSQTQSVPGILPDVQ